MILNCIAVDDEPVALDMIAQYVSKTPFLKLIEKCSSAVKALQVLHEHPEIQLVFLDIRMADLSGMELAKILDRSPEGLRISLRSSGEWVEQINAARLRLGRRVYFRTSEIANVLDAR